MIVMSGSPEELENFACRSCGGGESELVLDLGEQPLANNLPCADDLSQPEPRFPLRLVVCAPRTPADLEAAGVIRGANEAQKLVAKQLPLPCLNL